MKKREWKRDAKTARRALKAAESRAGQYHARYVDLDQGIGEIWQVLRDDGCMDCGLLPEVLKAWLARKGDASAGH